MRPLRIGVAVAAVAVAAITAVAWTTPHAFEGARAWAATIAADERRVSSGPEPDSARVASLLSALRDADPLVCEMVAERAGQSWWGRNDGSIGRFADARSDLLMTLDSLNGRIRHASTIRLLVASLNGEHACVRRVAARWLGRSDIETARLVTLLDDASPRVREAAAYAIGSGHKRPARAALESMLARRGPAEAAMAAWALGEDEDVASVPALERGLRHDDTRVRQASAQALGEIGALRSLEALSAALADRQAEVRYTAARAIGELDDLERPPAALVEATRSSDPRLARIAALIVAELHDPATLDVLLSLATMNDPEVRREVAEGLGEIGSVRANPVLMRLLEDSDADVRRAAAEALGELRENRKD